MGSKVLQLGHTFFSFEKGVSVGYNGFLFPRLYLHTQVYFVYEKYLGKVWANYCVVAYTIVHYSFMAVGSRG